MKLDPYFFREIPDHLYNLKVTVDRSACGPPPEGIAIHLDQMEQNGVAFTLPQIIETAATLFAYPGSDADIKRAWNSLETWSFPISDHHFIALPPANDTLKKTGTEALGVGIALLIAEKLYGIPLKYWRMTKGNTIFDFQGTHPDTNRVSGLQPICLEARARLDRNNWQEAIAGATKKLNTQMPRDFATALAVVFAPRSKMPERDLYTEDILIMDPENTDVDLNECACNTAPLRALLYHYAPFFVQQGGHIEKWGKRLLELADSDEATFARYIYGGDDALRYDKRNLERPWRTFFRYDGQLFCGSAFTGENWPIPSYKDLPEHKPGMFYWGLWEPIIEALRDGRLQDIAEMEVTPGNTEHKGRHFVLQSDGIALAWAPGANILSPDLFDDLFPSPSEVIGNQKQTAIVARSA